MAGWEGTAHDSIIFNVVTNDRSSNFPSPPAGQYYLVDSGYPLQTGNLPPYRNMRYHIPHFRDTTNQPKSANKVFNYYHSSLRMAVERTFGIWKKNYHSQQDAYISVQHSSESCRIYNGLTQFHTQI